MLQKQKKTFVNGDDDEEICPLAMSKDTGAAATIIVKR